MSLIIIKIVNSIIMASLGFYIVKRLVNSKESLFKCQNIISIVFIMIPMCLLYERKYSLLLSMCTYIVAIFVFKRVFKISIETSILSTSVFMFLTAIIDAIGTSVELSFFTYDEIRLSPVIAIANNVLVVSVSMLLTNIKFLKELFQKFCVKVNSDESLSKIVFAILTVFIIGVLYYNITSIFKLNFAYTITIIALSVFFILYYFYIEQQAKYEKLNNEYDTLFNYVQNFENWIDDEQMYRHELKNNLAIIGNMTKNKKIIEKIDEMLKFSIIIDEQAIEDLKNIPKGGLKGLIYYKVALAKNKKVKMVVEVSPKVKSFLKKIPEKYLRQLCIVLGIYLDNALEAAERAKKRQITLEVYEANDIINFTISNTYKDLISLKDMKKKGFTTKGENHGKGLYYVSKILKRTKWLESNQIFLNNYFIQKISIKKIR